MNLFIIPSWYPNIVQPIAGIFFKEQAEAIAELNYDIRVLVSTWGHDVGHLGVPSVKKYLFTLRWRFHQPANQIRQLNGVMEVFNPKLTWSHRLPFGGINQLINVNRINLRLAIKNFGKIDLMHAHVSYPAGYVSYVLSREFEIPYVLTEHMGPFPVPFLMSHGRPLPEIDQAFEGAAATIAVSPSLAKRVVSFGYPKPMVIPNAVDERRFDLGEPCTDKFIFFTLCGITKQKGIEHLLKSIAHWNPPADHFEFRIGGDGPMRFEYERMANQLGITNRVHWLGAVSREETPKLFRECHAYVMPSHHETFGMVYAEAIASGKPVIATRCGGPESIVNESNGILIDIGDINALSAAMSSMARDWAKYDPQMIREDFLKRFSRKVVINQLTSLYQRVLGDR